MAHGGTVTSFRGYRADNAHYRLIYSSDTWHNMARGHGRPDAHPHPLDGATRDLFDEAKARSSITTYTDVVRHAVTTLVRRLRAESKP